MKETTVERAPGSVRERLILAAIDEAQEVGFERFSARRVAEACGVSCAAPYKHFKNKRDFLEAIVDYIADVWIRRQDALLTKLENESTRERLVRLALEFIRFMVENPSYRTILMIKDDSFDSDFLEVKAKISARSKTIIERYCEEVGMAPKVAKVKMYVVRSLIYGASLMFSNGELPYDDYMMRYAREAIEREFDSPPYEIER